MASHAGMVWRTCNGASDSLQGILDASTSAARVVRRTTPRCLVGSRHAGTTGGHRQLSESSPPQRQRAQQSLAKPSFELVGREGIELRRADYQRGLVDSDI